MSKESALRLATGNPAAVPNPSLITPEATAAPKIVPDPAAKPTDPPAAAAASTTPETPSAADPAKDDRLSIFVKKEAQLFKEREAVKQERLTLTAKQKEYDEVIKRARDFETLAKTDKVQALKMLGWSDTDIVNSMNQDPTQPNPIEEAKKLVQEETQKIRQEFEDKEKKAASDRDESLVRGLQEDIKASIEANKEKFKFAAFKSADAKEYAWQVIVDNLKATSEFDESGKVTKSGELMSVDEAVQITNDIYKEEYEAIHKLMQPAPPAAPETPAAPVNNGARGPMTGRPPVSNIPTPKPITLTNAVTATATGAAPTLNRRESHSEKRERLINAIKTHGLRK